MGDQPGVAHGNRERGRRLQNRTVVERVHLRVRREHDLIE
jgi:hypothetical protein